MDTLNGLNALMSSSSLISSQSFLVIHALVTPPADTQQAKTIKGLAKNASGKGARDATDYGETHTKYFYQHHSTAISLACVQGSAMSLVTGLENLERSTTNDRNKRANASSCRDFFSANSVAAA